LPRLQRLEEGIGEVLDWAETNFPDFDRADPAKHYGRIVQRLFPFQANQQREFELLCREKYPGFGYATLASLISENVESFGVVLTTNFDDLLVDAFHLFSTHRPTVVFHDQLTEYMRRDAFRPLIVKLHGDFRTNPLNTQSDLEKLPANIRKALHDLLKVGGLIFMGYGGRDEGVRRLLEHLSDDDLPLGIYWLSRNRPTNQLRHWLDRRNAFWVKSNDFEEAMLLALRAFEMRQAEAYTLQLMAEKYRTTARATIFRAIHVPSDDPANTQLKKAAEWAEDNSTGWWEIHEKAIEVARSDHEIAIEIYETGLKQLPKSSYLMFNFASFLTRIGRNSERAETLYETALRIDPRNSRILSDYAAFHRTVKKTNFRARELYEQAIIADPTDDVALSNFANFLRSTTRDLDECDRLFRRALDSSPYSIDALISYAGFLSAERADHDRADQLYQRALSYDPNNPMLLMNYASFLSEARNDVEQADQLYERAMAIGGTNPRQLADYAIHLWTQKGDLDDAESFLRSAIEASPPDYFKSRSLVMLAELYESGHANFIRSRECLLQAKAITPNDPRVLTGIAVSLKRSGADSTEIESAFKAALTANPEDDGTRIDWGIYLHSVGRIVEAIEEYLEAIRINSESRVARVNLGGLYFALGEPEKAQDQFDYFLGQKWLFVPSAVSVEYWFYIYAHSPPPYRSEALSNLRLLIEAGARSKGWNLSQNVQMAEREGHPVGNWLGVLAQVITQDSPSSALDSWTEWESTLGTENDQTVA